MALTIDDIYDKEFALKGGGYDRNDVDQFLDEICDEMTNMQERIDQLESELSKARAEAEAARESVKPAPQPVAKAEPAVAKTSQTLESILLSAQRLADDGGDVQCYRMLDAVHGYLLYPTVFNIVKDTYRIIKQFLDGDPLVQEGEPTWLGLLGTD